MEADNQLIEYFEKIQKANKEGFVGCMPNGNLMDRKEKPEAWPVAENTMFGIGKPRCIKCKKETNISLLENSLCPECRK